MKKYRSRASTRAQGIPYHFFAFFLTDLNLHSFCMKLTIYTKICVYYTYRYFYLQFNFIFLGVQEEFRDLLLQGEIHTNLAI